MAIAPNVRLEFKLGERPKFDLPKKVSGLTRHVNDYVYNHIDSDLRRIRKKVVNHIYSYIKNPGRPRRLDRATFDFKERVNQYSSNYGTYFNYIYAPHLATIIGDRDVLVKPKGHKGLKYLTIPNTAGGIKPNARIRDFGITTVKFNPAKYGGAPYWYKGDYPKSGTRSPKGTRRNVKPRDWRQILFWAKEEVVRKPFISTEEIRNVMTEDLSRVYHKLAVRGITDFFNRNKVYGIYP